MEPKTSKAQLEVWDWKETVSSELARVRPEERIDYILKKTETTVRDLSASYSTEAASEKKG